MNVVAKLKKELIEAGRRAYQRGIQTGNGGNISARIPGTELMIVKASGVSFIDCTEENLLICDFAGNLVEGNLKPTREALLHGALYAKLPHVGAVVHTHSVWSILWSMSGSSAIPLVTQHAHLKIGTPIPILSFATPVVPKEHMPEVLSLFDQHPNLPAFVLKEHGVVAVGPNALEAEHNAEFVEETAQIGWLHQLAAGRC
jgi:L-ribulose-5-phosphate 4-epimerase